MTMSRDARLMKAAVLHRFGSEEQLVSDFIPIPEIGADEVLLKLTFAGIGQWDAFEREGGYAEMLGMKTSFPYVLGSEGTGQIVAMGEDVKGYAIGDQVIGTGFLNPKGGFYAEYAAVDARLLMPVPEGLSLPQAGVITGAGLTALRGLEDVLHLKKGESIAIFGASGGVGHLAAQLAHQMDARVFAVASGKDGVDMIKRLGIESAVDGYSDDLHSAALTFAPEGFDAALFTAGGEKASLVLQRMKPAGRIAYPNGIAPLPAAGNGARVTGYNGEPDADIINRLAGYLETGRIRAHIDAVFPLDEASSAHLALKRHYLGKLCLTIG